FASQYKEDPMVMEVLELLSDLKANLDDNSSGKNNAVRYDDNNNLVIGGGDDVIIDENTFEQLKSKVIKIRQEIVKTN
ncbi:MAG: hypothetical protein HC830_13520, partial [Bacteroidetes bacterium]|nr:hypothetical protein [Bacteroidota bacterium]